MHDMYQANDVLKINEIVSYDAYVCIMMYGNVMFLAGENKSRIATGE